MKKDKITLLIISLIVTGIFLFFSIPSFIQNEKIEDLLTRINKFQYGEIENNTLNGDGAINSNNSNNQNNNNNSNNQNNNNETQNNPNENGAPNQNNNNSENSNENNSTNNNTTNTPQTNLKTFQIIFEQNGAFISETQKSCQTSLSSCQIKLPSITSNKDVLGWSENKDATKETYKPNTVVTIDSNKTLYAITKKTVTAKVHGNGAFEGIKHFSCDMFNESTICSVTLPTLERDFYTSFGFNKNSSSDTIEYQENQTIQINQTIDLYSIRKINTSNYDSYSSVSQEVFNKINNLRQSKGLKTLKYSKSLELSAMLRAKEIAQNYDYNVNGDYHYRISNGKPFYTVNEMAYGENYWESSICDANTFHNTFENSPSHLQNMLRNDINLAGIGIGQINGTYYIVELFGIDI